MAACPKCGAIYSRVVAHLKKQAEAREAEQAAQQVALVLKEEKEKKAAEARDKQEEKVIEAARLREHSVQLRPKKSSIVKTYRGKEGAAMRAFQRDADTMAANGYVPTTQEWAPGTYGCGMFILATILCFVLFGILIFIYMLIVKPAGVLSVTYQIHQEPLEMAARSTGEKTCPQCAERVKTAAVICRYCRFSFE